MTRKMLVITSALVLIAVQALAQSASVVLDDGTPIRLRTTQSISSADARTDDRVDFEVVDDVKVGDVIVIKHGTAAIGTVTDAQSKGRMGKGGKLNVNIDFTRTVTGDKVALRGAKDVKGGGHTGVMTGAMVGTAIVFWPAAPLFLFMHGKDITVPKGHEFNVYTSGAVNLDSAKLAAPGAAPAPSSSNGAVVAVTSMPAGAEINVDGNFVGSTPSSVPVGLGNHSISVSKSGYTSWQRTIRVTGGTVSVAAELSRSVRASAGR
jgi:PEGA domain